MRERGGMVQCNGCDLGSCGAALLLTSCLVFHNTYLTKLTQVLPNLPKLGQIESKLTRVPHSINPMERRSFCTISCLLVTLAFIKTANIVLSDCVFDDYLVIF